MYLCFIRFTECCVRYTYDSRIMLTLYRRHLKSCSKASDRFNCPMWGEGTANDTYVRGSLKTGSWERATHLARVIEDSANPADTPERKDEPVTILQAVTEYLADARRLSSATRPLRPISWNRRSPVAITRHGDTVGYFIPARRKRSETERAALREAAAIWQAILASEGLSRRRQWPTSSVGGRNRSDDGTEALGARCEYPAASRIWRPSS